MRSLNIPVNKVNDIFPVCINSFTNVDKVSRLEKCLPYIIKKEKEYIDLKSKKLLYTMNDKICEEHGVENEELKSVYKQKFSGADSPGRNFYNLLKNSSKNKTCPICGQRKVTTLDHYLSQKHYPSLVVMPINLIPSCFDCNKTKSSAKATNHIEETIHPYFDRLGEDRFLFMEVSEHEDIIDASEITVNFYIKKPISWDIDLFERVKNHFIKFELNELYKSHAADEITGQIDIWANMKKEDIRSHLIELADSRKRIHNNSWQVALYEGLANDEWFCYEGYKAGR